MSPRQSSRAKANAKPRPKTRIERSAGGVVWRRTESGPEFLIILDSHDSWALPKGRLEREETTEQAAYRETTEETGLSQLTTTADLGATDFWFEDKWERKGERVHKFVSYFLLELLADEPVITSSEEHVQDHRWVTAVDFTSTLTYPSLKPVIAATFQHLGLVIPDA